MRRIILLISFLIISTITLHSEANPYTVELARMFTKEVFELNGVPYLNPMVESVNATANSRFFSSAYIPQNPEKPYFKFSIQSMCGIVPDSKKNFKIVFPMEELKLEVKGDYIKVGPYMNYYPLTNKADILDTAGLIFYAFKTLIYNGVKGGAIEVPEKSATILGSQKATIFVPNSVMDSLIVNHPVYSFLPAAFQDTLREILKQFPDTFNYPPGANLNYLYDFVPQIEIGGMLGSEILLRFIPPVYMGSNIGHFAFWGFGLKHSISQYLYNNDNNAKNGFNCALQAIYQGTYLYNSVGQTNAEFHSYGTFWNLNISLSKNIDDFLDIFSGFSMEFASFNTEYKYYLPIEIQTQIGLLYHDMSTGITHPPDPEHGFPGDNNPQYTTIKIDDTNYKWIIGVSKPIGNFDIIADFSISKFIMFGLGIQYRL
jgi:hypothetical protein